MSHIMSLLDVRDPTPAEVKLALVIDKLFPDLVEVSEGDTTMVTDYSIDSNLHAALVDLEEGQNDKVTRTTILKCIVALQELREILGVEQQVTEKARYLMVDAPDNRPIT